jgi:hypothetical protein
VTTNATHNWAPCSTNSGSSRTIHKPGFVETVSVALARNQRPVTPIQTVAVSEGKMAYGDALRTASGGGGEQPFAP